jgi:hypothetical protein
MHLESDSRSLAGSGSRGREPDFVQHLYSRFAFLAFVAFLAFLEISNLRVLNTLSGFDSRRLHHLSKYTIISDLCNESSDLYTVR